MNEASISGVTMPSLRAQLAIYESRPELPLHATAEFTRQLWVGGNTDRTTRTMAEEPRRWLVLVETATKPAEAPFPDGELRSWDLEQINPGDQPSPAAAAGLILSSMDIEASVEEEFNDWYNTEHIPVLAKLPGMLAARRFRAHRGSPRYVALYHVADLAIYALRTWYSVNDTPWTLRMRRFQSNRTYFMFRAASPMAHAVVPAAQTAPPIDAAIR
jgi:hypothetical protein